MNDAVLLPNGQIIIVNGAKVSCKAAQHACASAGCVTLGASSLHMLS
jgi:hypothetical protein